MKEFAFIVSSVLFFGVAGFIALTTYLDYHNIPERKRNKRFQIATVLFAIGILYVNIMPKIFSS